MEMELVMHVFKLILGPVGLLLLLLVVGCTLPLWSFLR